MMRKQMEFRQRLIKKREIIKDPNLLGLISLSKIVFCSKCYKIESKVHSAIFSAGAPIMLQLALSNSSPDPVVSVGPKKPCR
jgi:hypothetical protein